MNRLLLSLWLAGAALYTANSLTFSHPNPPSTAAETLSAPGARPTKDASSAQPPLRSAQSSQVPVAASIPADGPEAFEGQTTESKIPNTEPAPSLDSQSAPQPTIPEDEHVNWAEVTRAAQVHSAPSVSAPTIRYYRIGTELQVIGRELAWLRVVDPTTLQQGWIYEIYLTPKGGPKQALSGLPQESQEPGPDALEIPDQDIETAALNEWKPSLKPKTLRKQYGSRHRVRRGGGLRFVLRFRRR